MCIALFGLFAGTSLYGNYSKANSNDNKNTRIDFEKSNISILVAKLEDLNDDLSLVNDIYLININLDNNTFGVFDIDTTQQLKYAENLGNGDLEKLNAITYVENEDFSDILEQTILINYSINVDKFILIDEKFDESLDIYLDGNLYDVSKIKNINKVRKMLIEISANSVSDIVSVDIIKLYNFFRNVDEKHYKTQAISDKKTLMKKWRSYNSISSDIQTEQVKVFIANASMNPKIPGLASWGEKVVANVGGSVMHIDNSFLELDESVIITESLELNTYKLLAKQFGINNVILKDDITPVDGYNPEVYRTQVSIYLVGY